VLIDEYIVEEEWCRGVENKEVRLECLIIPWDTDCLSVNTQWCCVRCARRYCRAHAIYYDDDYYHYYRWVCSVGEWDKKRRTCSIFKSRRMRNEKLHTHT
jgi:hypothetical protein